jgi:hypothetical protein
MSRRDQIKMTPEEVLAFLDEEKVVTCATQGPRGWPHLMPLWFVVRSTPHPPTLWAWTFGKSQKVKNLERDPRATLQVEAGADRYDQLRGVMLECDVVVHTDLDTTLGVGLDVFRRYGGGAGDLAPEVEAMVRKQAEKRVALEFRERTRATWDHRKLGGVY